MKKNILFLIIIISLIACKTEKPKDYAVLSGTISAIEKDKISLYDLGGNLIKELIVTKDGRFSDTLKIESNYYSLYDGINNIDLYLSKSHDLKLTYTINDSKNTLQFEGENSNENQYLLGKGAIIKDLEKDWTLLYSLSENDFISKINNTESQLKELANSFKLNKTFLNQELKNIHYVSIDKFYSYESAHSYYAKNREFKVSDSFPLDITKIDLNNAVDYINSSGYRNILRSYYMQIDRKDLKDKFADFHIANLYVLHQNISNEIIRNGMLFDNAKRAITFTENLNDYYATFIDYSTDSLHKEEITKTYNKLKATAKESISPKFTSYINHKGGTTSLDDLKGTYVYIDIWATWCAPCITQIPYLKKIENQYHGKNITFVSISVDTSKDYDKWKNFVTEKELGGIQLFADKSFESQFVEDYLIKGIPRFILINPEGKIVTPNAPRPSLPALVKLFTDEGI